MAVFVSKNKKKRHNISRIPYGNLTVGPYIIRPYTSSLQSLIDEELKALLNSNPKCVDGQNGNVLDNVIECWEKRAKNGISKQKAYHLERIRDLVAIRDANYQNAQDLLKNDEEKLKKLLFELNQLESVQDKFTKDMPKW